MKHSSLEKSLHDELERKLQKVREEQDQTKKRLLELLEQEKEVDSLKNTEEALKVIEQSNLELEALEKRALELLIKRLEK